MDKTKYFVPTKLNKSLYKIPIEIIGFRKVESRKDSNFCGILYFITGGKSNEEKGVKSP